MSDILVARPVVHASAPHRHLSVPAGRPLLLAIVAFPVWWALGMGAFVWPLSAIPMAASLLMRRKVSAPRGFGVWLMFVGWIALSATRVDAVDRWLAYAYRGSLYASATVIFLYIYNTPSLTTKRIVAALTILWACTIAGGYAGVLAPTVQFESPLAKVLPASVDQSELVNAILHPGFAEYSRILGYPIGRPKAPFAFTNAWGSNLALLTPFAIASLAMVRRRWWRRSVLILFPAALIPVIASLDRGVWLSLGLGVTYIAVRFALRGHARMLLGLGAVVCLFGILIVASPLQKVVEDRLAHPHSDVGREALYRASIENATQSPLLGYGAPLPNEADPTKPSIGTHGQFWLVLVSQGFPGALLFVGWLAVLSWKTRNGAPELGLWVHLAIVMLFAQILYYEQLPTQMQFLMIGAALALREQGAARVRPLPE